jgi:OPA family sugar phosphate sensor protein UhpC-like MFS transporter
MGFLNFFKTSAPAPLRDMNEQEQKKYHRSLALQSFVAGTLGYSLYYVCRTSLNVMKKPILDSGMLDATQLGIIGSALLFAYAIGKFVNGFLADHSNIKRFMATGLLVSTLANLTMGVVGLFGSGAGVAGNAVIPSAAVFVIFAIMWGINGWSQSMGAAPAIIALSRWFPLSRRGTFYGFFSASHNIGEWLSFIFVGSIVAVSGWQWGFFGAAIAGAIGIVIILFLMHDTPESKGLPSIEVLTGEKVEEKKKDDSAGKAQILALKTPAVWILALASAFMYISRYSLNSWGILFLQEEKGFELADATFIISINALLGILGTVLAGWMSDVLFKGDRKMPAFVSGVLLSISYALFVYGGNEYWVNIASMVLFGIAIGVLIAFLGGLMAIDVVPRKATGAALGIVGCASYIAAGIQDVVSGWLIDKNLTETVTQVTNEAGEIVEQVVKHYDFSDAAIFWIGASVISFLLPILNWGKKVQE